MATCMPHADGAAAMPQSGTEKGEWIVPVEGFPQSIVAADGVSFVLAGSFGVINDSFGGVAVDPPSPTLVLARVGATGGVEWVRSIGATSGGSARLQATEDGLLLLVTGVDLTVDGTAPTAAADLELTASNPQVAIARISFAGVVQSVTSFAQAASDLLVDGFQVDAAGAAHALLRGTGLETWGTARECVVLSRFSAAGTESFSRCVNVAGTLFEARLSVDPNGNSYVSGFPGGAVDLGAGTIEVDASAGGSLLAKIDADANTVWDGAVLRTYAKTLLATPDERLFISGNLPQTTAANGLVQVIEQTYLPCDDGLPYQLSAIGGDGTHEWSRAYGNRVEFLALSGDEIFFRFQGVDEALGDLASGLPAAGSRLVGAVAQETGAVRWVQSGLGAEAAASAPGGGWFAAGYLENPIDWKGETITPAGTHGYVARFAP